MQDRSEPVTLTGCVKQGALADGTFVLLVPQTNGTGVTTYELSPRSGMNLKDDVGKQVAVSGTLESEQQFASDAAATAQKPKSTSGTPTVDTKSEIKIGRLNVTDVKVTNGRCD